MTKPPPLLLLHVPSLPQRCLAVVAPDGQPPKRDIQPAEIVGHFACVDGKPLLTPASFSPGQPFTDFLHQSIARRAPTLANYVASAHAQGGGYLYVIDGRTPTPQGNVPLEDIICNFRVEAGQISPAGYTKGPQHRLYTERGFFQLEPALLAALLEDLVSLGGAGRADA